MAGLDLSLDEGVAKSRLGIWYASAKNASFLK